MDPILVVNIPAFRDDLPGICISNRDEQPDLVRVSSALSEQVPDGHVSKYNIEHIILAFWNKDR